MEKLLISACFIGENVKYDGGNNKLDDFTLLQLKKRFILLPFCPEVAGGLPTPRSPAERINKKVVTKSGVDVTKEFLDGAKKTLEFCKKNAIKKALLKEGSPSCGSSYIYDGTFTSKKISQQGVTAELLRKNSIKVFSEKELIFK